LLARAVAFLLLPVYTRFITPPEFGSIDLLLAISALAFLTVPLEVGQGSGRLLPEADTDRRKSLIGAALAFAVPAYVVFAVALVVLADPVATHYLGSPDAVPLVRVAAVAIAIAGVSLLMRNQLKAMMHAVRYAIASVAAVLVGGAVGVVLVAIANLGPTGWFLGFAAGAAVAIAATVALGEGVYRVKWSREHLSEMLRYSLPLVPSGVAVFLMVYADRLILNATLGLEDVGIYGLGLRVASVIGALMLAFQFSLTPLVHASYREPETPRTIEKLFRAVVTAGGIASVAVAVFAPELVGVLGGSQYAGATVVVPILATATVLGGLYVFSPGLTIAKRTGLVALIAFVAAGLTTASGLLLVPAIGIVGAAAAALVGSSSMFVGYVLLGRRYYPIPFRWRRVGIVLAIVLTVDLLAMRGNVEPLGSLPPRLALAAAATGLILVAGPTSPAELRSVMSRTWASFRSVRNPVGADGRLD
jgi:O-antigen/teichoic acid export membrane protein